MVVETFEQAQEIIATPKYREWFGEPAPCGYEDDEYFWVNLVKDGYFSTYTGFFVEKKTGKKADFGLWEGLHRTNQMRKVGDWSNPPEYVPI